MSTIKDVAKEAGVSIATVSRVVNKSPKASKSAVESVTNAMKKLGYRPNEAARALVSQKSNIIGVVVSDVSDPFFGLLIKTVDKIAYQHGKHTLIGNGYHQAEQERDAIELLIKNRCDALIVHAKALTDEELIHYAKEVKGMVLINRFIEQIADRCISLDNYQGAYIATEHLIKNGHKNIACIASNHLIEDADARKSGYLAALKDHDIILSEDYIAAATPDAEGGIEAMNNLLEKDINITAVLAYNDYMAAGALSVAQEKGIQVPKQLSIVGFDNGLIARYLYPRLTTVNYPIELMAEKAAILALKRANNETVETQQLNFSPTIVLRDSACKANN
ncbi:transcriptional regulator [Psychromonas marina]|uniref:Transcriptional regulator n=1 Tax=Psychromonas marina TaxID=88364 RepID=A0ABQ6E174_9GAMM|nr:substrate-binding domain-containing protein [Psychromonas marina]GLS91101.1 transcriptional regulator [Psychromonas marina]